MEQQYYDFFVEKLNNAPEYSSEYYAAYDELRFKIANDKTGISREEWEAWHQITPLTNYLAGDRSGLTREEKDQIFVKYNIDKDTYQGITVATNAITSLVRESRK
jgi:hypothetical protein